MKLFHNILVLIAIGLFFNNKDKKPLFAEKIIDDQAPAHVWMKTIGDINGDGKTDILVGGRHEGGIVAYLAPDWKKQIINDSLHISTNAEICDLDNNKILDIVVVVNRAIVWLAGPEWTVHLIDSAVAHDVEVYDFDNDGLLDVISRNQGAFGKIGGNMLHFYNQKPLGVWTKYQKEILDGEGLKMGDINKDKKQDIVTNGHWFENTGNMASWEEHKFTDTWTWPNTYIDVADMNNDGLPDILHSPAELAGTYYRISWFEAPKNPSSIWKERIISDSVETIVHSIGAADFNSNGKMDVIVAEMQQGADPDEVTIFYNEGGDTWDKQVISTGGSHSMCLFDFDRDGDMDAVGANFAEHIVKMWVNERKH